MFDDLVSRCARSSFRMGQLLSHCALPGQVYPSALEPRLVIDKVPLGMAIPGLVPKLQGIVKDQALRVRSIWSSHRPDVVPFVPYHTRYSACAWVVTCFKNAVTRGEDCCVGSPIHCFYKFLSACIGQLSVTQSCASTLKSDCVDLLRRLHKGQHKPVLVRWSPCHVPIVLEGSTLASPFTLQPHADWSQCYALSSFLSRSAPHPGSLPFFCRHNAWTRSVRAPADFPGRVEVSSV